MFLNDNIITYRQTRLMFVLIAEVVCLFSLWCCEIFFINEKMRMNYF